MAVQSYHLPYVTLRPDYAQIYRDVVEKVTGAERPWVSVYSANAPQSSIHAKLSITTSDRADRADVDVEQSFARELSIQQIDGSDMDLSIASTSQQGGLLARRIYSGISLPATVLRLPKRTEGPLAKGRGGITAFDVANTPESHYVVGGEDGQAHVGRLSGVQDTISDADETDGDDVEGRVQRRIRQRLTEQAASRRTYLKGHVGDLRTARFFPSGQVILTTSSDCTARIFGLDGANPRTLKGHRRAVTASAFLNRGKVVLTGSLDGTIRVWDVGSDKQLKIYDSTGFSGVNALALGDDDRLLYAGLSNGSVEVWDLGSGTRISNTSRSTFPLGDGPAASDRWTQEQSGGISALAVDPKNGHILAGTTNGILTLFDGRMLASVDSQGSKAMLTNWRRNGATINDVVFAPDDAVAQAVIATADGTPYRVDLNEETPKVVEEFCGWDVDNVQACAFDQRGRVWLAGAEGMAMMY